MWCLRYGVLFSCRSLAIAFVSFQRGTNKGNHNGTRKKRIVYRITSSACSVPQTRRKHQLFDYFYCGCLPVARGGETRVEGSPASSEGLFLVGSPINQLWVTLQSITDDIFQYLTQHRNRANMNIDRALHPLRLDW